MLVSENDKNRLSVQRVKLFPVRLNMAVPSRSRREVLMLMADPAHRHYMTECEAG